MLWCIDPFQWIPADSSAASPTGPHLVFQGRLLRITDRNNNSISWSCEVDGDWIVTDTQGRAVSFTGTGSVIESIDDPTDRAWEYGYECNQRLTSYLDPNEGETLYRYDTAGRINQITDPYGNLTRITYDTNDRVTAVTRVIDGTVANDVTTRYSYPGVDGACPPGTQFKTVVTDPRGNPTTTYCADADRQVTKAINALNFPSSRRYTPNGDSDRYEDLATIQVLIDRESILTGAATGGEQPWKYYDLGDGYCTNDFFAKCQHRLACAATWDAYADSRTSHWRASAKPFSLSASLIIPVRSPAVSRRAK